MIRKRFPTRTHGLAAALLVVSAMAFATATPAGAGVGGSDSGTVKVNVTERTDIVDSDDVTVLVRWVGAGVDLGPAPAGDPVFESLPAGYSVTGSPVIDRVETGVTEDETFSQELDTGDWVYGEDFTGDPNDPFSWIAYGNEDITIGLTLVQTITRTHHVTETRTSTVVRDGDDPTPSTTVPDATAPTTTVPASVAPSSTVGPVVGAESEGAAPLGASPATAVSADPTYAG